MRSLRGATRATALAACVALAFAGQSCGVMSSSSDCSEKATCPEGGVGGSSGSGSSSGSIDEGGIEGATAEAGDDGSGQGDNSVAEVGMGDRGPTGDGPTADVTSDTVGSADVTSEDSTVRDVANPPDASIDVVSADRPIVDVGTDQAAMPDVCVPTAAAENCTDGIDDDCNGLIDCAESVCQSAGYACVTAAPTSNGWIGPALLWTGSSATGAPNCPSGYQPALDAHAGPTGTPDACGCTCGASGQVCTTTGTFHQDQACQVTCNGQTISVTLTSSGTSACTSVTTNCGSGGSFGAGAVTPPSGGSCTPTVTPTSGSAMGWTTSARVCSWVAPPDAPGGCTAGQQCLLGNVGNPGGFRPTFCVYQAGNVSCPASYPNQNLFYSGETDGRGCGSCTCSAAPSGGTCAGSIGIWRDLNSGCGGPAGATYTLGSTCQSYGGLANVPGFVQANYTVTPGTCSVTAQPQPTGAVTPTGPTTVCCK